MKPSSEARRLHPLTLVQRFIVSLPGLVFILLPVFRETDSTAWFNLFIAVVYAAFLLPWIAVYYIRFRYWITPTELIIHSGVVTRRKRNIPIDRIQNIEVEQGPLQRILGTAKVAVYTAGSSKAEGVLEYVSADEAREIREGIRQIQEDLSREGQADQGALKREAVHVATLDQDNVGVQESEQPLFQMDFKRVLMAGAFHFSLLYIAGMFSLIQYFDPDPAVFMDWLLRGPLEGWNETIQASPWTAALMGGLLAIFLGWATGVLVTINKVYHFSVSIRDAKLHRKQGLLTLAEGTIPFRKIQSFIIRTNPLSLFFGYSRLELQTLGIDVKDSGFQVAAPLANVQELDQFLSKIGSMGLPDHWKSVSPITIRRFGIRYSFVFSVLLLALYGLFPSAFPAAYWSLVLLPIIWIMSLLRYRHMGFALMENGIAIKRGIIKRHVWLIPTHKAQTFSTHANYFQRRLGLTNLYVDTAGASAMNAAELVDVPIEVAREAQESLYEAFKRL